MSYRGDIRVGGIIYFHFTTRQFSTGAPLTSASLAISAYKNDSTAQSTSGITTTFSSGFDNVAGLVSVKVDTSSDGTFYAAGSDISLVVTGGTVDSVSIVGEVIGAFSIEARSALMPTTAARTLDVSATGEAGVDWANVGGQATAVNLSATNIDTDQVVASVTGAVGSVTGAVGSVTGNVGGNVVGSVASVTGNVAGSVASVTGNVGGNVVGSVASVTGAVGSVTGNVGGSVASVVGNVGGSVASVAGNVGGNVVGSVASVTDTGAIADKVLGRSIVGGADGGRKVGDALKTLRNKVEIAAGTMTVYEADDLTPAFTALVTTAAGNPITSIDPA